MDHSVKNEGDGSAEIEVVETPQRAEGLDASNTAEVATVVTSKQQEDPSAVTDEISRLRELQADIRDQDDLERDISRQVLDPISLIGSAF
jgi:DNA excision repair protein ERCC-6